MEIGASPGNAPGWDRPRWLGPSGTLVLNPVLKSVLVRVSPTDSIALAGSSTMLLIAASLGCAIPARRATRIDPMSAIRHE